MNKKIVKFAMKNEHIYYLKDNEVEIVSVTPLRPGYSEIHVNIDNLTVVNAFFAGVYFGLNQFEKNVVEC